ncbi:MAG: ABC transporter ATP-binding protein [Acidobacteriota bacterium]
MTILRLNKISKSLPFGFWLRPRQVLREVSLSVQEGEVYGFIGPNGAGKTTSIKCILGLLLPDSGSVELLGEPGATLSARQRLGYLPEQPYFYPHLSGHELLEYFGRLFGLRGAKLRRRCDSLLERVGLAADADKLTGQYSKGMLQRLGIAQALINEPDLVLLDEPMTGLDPIGRRQMKEIIYGVRDRGATVFLSSHILSDAEALCDRVGLLVAGRVLKEGTLAGLLEEQVEYWEAACEGIDSPAIAGFRPHTTQGDHHYYRLDDQAQVESWVDGVRAAGGRIYRLMPHRVTLEDYFVAAVRADQ